MATVGLTGRQLRSVRDLCLHLILIAIMIVLVTPFVWLLATSIKTPAEVFTKIPVFIPHHPTLDNYRYILTQTLVPRYFLNSLMIASLTAVG